VVETMVMIMTTAANSFPISAGLSESHCRREIETIRCGNRLSRMQLPQLGATTTL